MAEIIDVNKGIELIKERFAYDERRELVLIKNEIGCKKFRQVLNLIDFTCPDKYKESLQSLKKLSHIFKSYLNRNICTVLDVYTEKFLNLNKEIQRANKKLNDRLEILEKEIKEKTNKLKELEKENNLLKQSSKENKKLNNRLQLLAREVTEKDTKLRNLENKNRELQERLNYFENKQANLDDIIQEKISQKLVLNQQRY